MILTMELENTLRSVIDTLNQGSIPYAVIGGFALHFWGYTRGTDDLDFIVLAEQKDSIRQRMVNLGFTVYRETENVAHYENGSTRVDFIFSHSLRGVRLLERACDKDFLRLKLKVARAEDIIGLKVQSMANNPLRWLKEMADIENLLAENKGKLDLQLIEDYFKLFKKEKDWEDILKRHHASVE